MYRPWVGSKGRITDISSRGIRKFSFASLRIATNSFSKERLIGEGGSAKIYKGVLPNGTVVAVKRYRQSNQPEWGLDFLHIVEVMSHIRHRNVNQVIGCCVEKDNQLLVTEYADNGSLADLLQDMERKESVFNWHRRVAVCIGIARGLYYLHEDANPRVIHRDIKSSNILLDANFTPKITDFDIVDFFSDSDELPHQAAVVGSFVYLDPEYCATWQYTEKVDVYAFGVVMLEIISGRNAINMEVDFEDQLITGWVSKLAKNGRVLDIVDPALRDFPIDEVQRFIDVAVLCTQVEGRRRPSMNEVVLMLHGVCNSCRQVLSKFDMPITTTDVAISLSPGVGHSIGESNGKAKTEDGEESSNLQQGIVKLRDDESGDIATDSSASSTKEAPL